MNSSQSPCRLVLLAALLGFLALSSGRVNAQNLLQDGGFELGLTSPTNTTYNSTTYGAWTATGIASLRRLPAGSIPSYEGNEAVNLFSSVNPDFLGAVHQSIPTTVGTTYRVSLAVAYGNAQVIASSSGTTNLLANVVSPGSSLPITWGSNSYTFAATGPITTITVAGESSTGFSPFVDDVRVVAIPILFDGGFELGLTAGPGTYASRTTYGAWSAVGSPTTFLFGMPFGVTPAYQGQEALLIGNGGSAGFVTQPLATAIGQKYWVSFALNVADAGNGTARVLTSTPSQTNLNQTVVAPGSSQWGVASYSFIASGTNTTLRLQNVSGACIIDDVRVSTIPLDMALKFDGTNDYASLTNLGNRLPTTEVTVEFWQRVRSVKPQATFALSVDNGANRFAAFVPYSDGTIIWDFGNINSAVGRLSYKPPVSIVGNWHHFALVSSTVGNYMRIYRNGVLEAEKTGHSTFTRVANDLHLGRSGTGYFDGDLDEFRIWNVARSEAEIRDSLNARLTGSEAGLVAYHRMDAESGSLTLLDGTTNGNNGSLFNGPQRVASTVPVCGLASVTNLTSPATLTRIYEGYQAGGISFADLGGSLNVGLVVSNLCFDITPASGTPGVELNNYYSGDNLTLNYLGGSWTNFTTSADGLRARSKGDDGYTVDDADATAGLIAGTATAISSGTIITSGDNAAGIHTISLGGAGGVGEDSSVFNGEHGGSGGRGLSSTVNSSSTLVTSGNKSVGIYAVSQGGAGGKGGNSSVASGAYGGVGGNAGIASVTGSGVISTLGHYSMGVLALSQAGQGGNGGSGTIGNGGSGNYGGDGGAAKVDGNWTITTTGSNAVGILARSLGGSGGTAGDGSWASLTPGGSGGGSGSGSNAAVNFGAGGSINTYGREAHGILAQSVGGFAGGGGDSGLLLGSAGSGGSAGDGGNVTVTNQGTITTRGLGANAIFAESVGGGGGSGGSGGLFTGSGAPQAGGDAGIVSVNNQGLLTTTNKFANGIFAQSVGGSGGSGSTDLGLFYSVGGAGGKGGQGNNVTVINSGQIMTAGSDASGIFAQSVGGGGGAGGGSVTVGGWGSVSVGGTGGDGGDGALVNVTSSAAGSITTAGANANGILAQSVGGGGGKGGFSIAGSAGLGASGSVGIGGSGATGGSGSNVVVVSSSSITTTGTNAHGILAQSVGGGGGSGGYSVTLAGSDTAAVSLSLGGNAGLGGNGQEVNVTQQGSTKTIHTEGDHSYGILAQSIGGGGGDGGFSIAGALAGSAAVPLSFGGSGGAGGLGGNVTVSNSAPILTEGNDAHGLFAQSVGGGGGSGGFSISGGISGGGSVGAAFGGSGGGGASAGNVSVTHQFRAITTSGSHSYGILAQSIGGGGGDGGFSVAGSVSGGASLNFAMGGSGGAGGVAGTVNLNVVSGNPIATAGDNSHALFAQSLGGGGGSGGFAVAGGIAGGPSVSVGIGGPGGSGASGSNVTVTTTSTPLRTSGERSYGILAQSIGGGGGDAGFSVAGGISSGPSVNFAMGGSGGAGGVGGRVAVSSASSITTSNRDSHAIFAQSVGGGGGSGGFSVGGGIASGAAVSVGIGGAGGGGANANTVSVNTVSGTLTTHGERSYGILAQSVGGGGGDGGFSVAGGISSSPTINFSMGGGGGVAGNGAAVNVTNRSVIATAGESSHGVFAQSVGGGGGSGGFSVAGGATWGGAAISGTIGGAGGSGGTASIVNVTNSGRITTTGDGAYGIQAQSVGGGGGNGGMSFAGTVGGAGSKNVSLTIGGSGGSGNTSSNVVVQNGGVVETSGKDAHGIFAQSIGGSGGNGGTAVALALGGGGTSNKYNVNVSAALGGGGGGGGLAGDVLVLNSSNVTTHGSASHGIFAQSIGGGGGSGGSSVAITGGWDPNETNTVNASLAVGGEGGDGNHGGDVEVINRGNIETTGQASYGINAQSVGGGGGAGGSARALTVSLDPDDWLPGGDFFEGMDKTLNLAIGGSGGGASDGGLVTVSNIGSIVTHGDDAHGIFAQSVGGGGGVGGAAEHGVPVDFLGAATNLAEILMDASDALEPFSSLEIVLGGSGGSAGNGGAALVNNVGTIETFGDGSSGIFAQSVGGGGGVGGVGAAGITGKVGIGGAAGTTGNGGQVAVNQSGNITTHGINSHAITAQSIGGGGGMAGSVDRGIGDFGIGFGYANGGGNGGNGGEVSVVSAGQITTSNTASFGVFAQSVGGGGGAAGGIGTAPGFAGSTGGHGAGGDVEVVHAGDIRTYGDASHGIFAQSAGGTSGSTTNGNNYLGTGGDVDITVTGDVTASGTNSHGILAQSSGTAGVGDININILGSGEVHGGSGSNAVGVRIEGGDNNTLTNHGTITTLNGVTGTAILGGSGNDRVENYGTLIGEVHLGGGINAWNNYAGSIFNVQTAFDLGVGNSFNNSGLIRGSGRILGNVVNAGAITPGNSAGSLNIDGNLNLMASANLTFEIGGLQKGVTHDYIGVSNSVLFAGTLSLSLINDFVPSSTDFFTLMEFDSSSGLFGNALNGGRLLTLDNLGSFEVNYTSTSLQVGNFLPSDVGLPASIQQNASGHMVIQFPGTSAVDYAVEYTGSLAAVNWTLVSAPVISFPAPGVGQWVDDGSQTGGFGSSRFYRVKLLVSPAATTPP